MQRCEKAIPFHACTDLSSVKVRITTIKDEFASNTETPSTAANDEHILLDIIMEMVTSALRASTNEIIWTRYPDFPRFVPSHNPVEPILPVHYDSMVNPFPQSLAK